MTNSNFWYKKEAPLLGLSGMGGGAGGIMVAGGPVTSADAYQIEKSIKFNDGDTAYLKRRGGNGVKSGNRRTFTWSGWLKLGKHTGESFNIFNVSASPGNSASNVRRTEFKFASDYVLVFGVNSSGSAWKTLQTVAKFRDGSAWYHVVCAVDTNQSTEKERVKLYVNGELQTVTGNYPAQYEQTPYNMQSDCHALGTYINNLNDFYDGHMADVYWIDGLQLSPAAFGEFSTTYVWNPKAFSLPSPNDGRTWSSTTTNLTNPANTFDGSTGSGATKSSTGSSQMSITFDPPLKNITEFEVNYQNSGAHAVAFNGGALMEDAGGSATDGYWRKPPAGMKIPSTIDSFEARYNHSSTNSSIEITGIRVNGVVLVDGLTDTTTRTNVNDGTSWEQLVTGTANSGQGGDKAFDGDESTLSQATNGSNASLTFTPNSAISGRVEI